MRVAGLAQYDVRYSEEEIDEQTWESAQQAEGEPIPGEPSSLESFTLSGLEQATSYFIALKTADAAQNWSDLSNVVQGQTRAAFTIDPDGTGDFPTIQQAINNVPSGSIIELTDGTFVGDGNRDLDFMGKALTLRSQSGDPENCVINCEGTELDPHRGFIFQSGEGPSAIIQDISVRNGYASGTEFPVGYGGAVLCINGSDPAFKGSVFSECDAFSGGALFIRDSGPILEDCAFFFNNADFGAALRIEDSSAELTSCTFTRNEASSRGGGLSYSGRFLSLEYCDFIENSAGNAGGAICLDTGASLTLVNCEFSLNTATGGGAVGMLGGSTGADLTAVECTFADNVSDFGGAAHLIESSLDFISCSFFGNSVGGVIGLGGAISVVENSDLSISECLFTANESAQSGGALSVNQSSCELLNSTLTGNYSSGTAGAVHAFRASLDVDMCTFASNRATEIGGGIYLEGSDALLERSILWGNCAGITAGEAYLTFDLEAAQLGFICSAVDSAGIRGDGTVSYLGSQVFSDPLFCDPSTCDAAPTMDGDYSLSATSPCVEENSPCGDQIGALGQGCD
jgi:predicted outer membrane repeat protein